MTHHASRSSKVMISVASQMLAVCYRLLVDIVIAQTETSRSSRLSSSFKVARLIDINPSAPQMFALQSCCSFLPFPFIRVSHLLLCDIRHSASTVEAAVVVI